MDINKIKKDWADRHRAHLRRHGMRETSETRNVQTGIEERRGDVFRPITKNQEVASKILKESIDLKQDAKIIN